MSNLLSERLVLWDDLRKLRVTAPWMITGDFNNVLRAKEREGGNTPSIQEMRPFVECLEDCGLTDMRSRGRTFTWTNNTIRSKIDRVLVNEGWIDVHPDVEAHFTAVGLSDHTKSPIRLVRQ